MRNPHSLSSSFAKRMITLKESLDRVKLPESTAREFFEELADEEVCVCGSPITDKMRVHLKSHVDQYMGSVDDVALLNQLKGDVANLVGTEAISHEFELNQKISVLNGTRVSSAISSSSVGVSGVLSSLWMALTLGALCEMKKKS